MGLESTNVNENPVKKAVRGVSSGLVALHIKGIPAVYSVGID